MTTNKKEILNQITDKLVDQDIFNENFKTDEGRN